MSDRGNPDANDDVEYRLAWLGVIRERAQAEAAAGAPMFMGIPDRWYQGAGGRTLFRCENGHVSVMVLKSEALGRDACLAAYCEGRVTITWPEDVEDDRACLVWWMTKTGWHQQSVGTDGELWARDDKTVAVPNGLHRASFEWPGVCQRTGYAL